MRQPAVRRSVRPRTLSQVSSGATIPAPTGGWDAQSPLAAMKPEYAPVLDNWIPRAGWVEHRRGYVEWQSGLPLDVESLMTWKSPLGLNDEIFAACGSQIFDVSSRGESPVEVWSGALSARWQWLNFSNDAGVFIIAANGADDPIAYNGTAFSSLSISGTSGVITLDPSSLIDVMGHKGRLFFVQKNSNFVWFLEPFAIQGAAQLLDLGPIFTKGGTIVCCETWTVDGGSGADDLAVFVSSQGQIAIYQGVDPSNAGDWALVGVYDVGFPLSRRSLIKYGSDLVVVTSDGIVPLSQALRLDRAQENLVALTQRIQNAFQGSVQKYGGNFGWEGMLYPRASLAIFNIPVTEFGTSVQYVQNVQTGAWCRFTGINAYCWSIANDAPMFGGRQAVYLWDTGYADAETTIVADMLTAYNYFGQRGVQKKFEMLQPIMRASQSVAPAVEIVTDFKDKVPTAVPTLPAYTAALWDQAIWDQSVWSASTEPRETWTAVTGIGYCGAVRVRVAIDPVSYVLLGESQEEDEVIISSDGEDEIAVIAARNVYAPVEVIAFNLKFQGMRGGLL